jgi:hypothetical protein
VHIVSNAIVKAVMPIPVTLEAQLTPSLILTSAHIKINEKMS